MILSLVIPCFNEELSIRDNILRIISFMKSALPELSFELLVVNDGSTDSTSKILMELQEYFSCLKILNHEFNKGRGAGMKTGLKASVGKYVMFLDADLSYDVDHIKEVVDVFNESQKVDAVIISPYMEGGVAKNIPFSRLMLSRTANWILAGFFSSRISTVTSMVRAYKGDLIRNLPLFEDGKELHLEILKKLVLIGANIKEIPGRLIWKEKKSRGARLNKRKVAASAGKHFVYGFVFKPTRFIGWGTLFIFLISLYEFFNVGRLFFSLIKISGEGFWRDVWVGLSQTFMHSPHTVIIAVTSLLVSIQLMSFLIILTVLRFQHEESIRHVVAILQKLKD
jgi:glycosyltransferase involved in cell wall biosynthesis